MDQETLTVILAILAVVGTLLGASLTEWFTLRNGMLQAGREKQAWLRKERFVAYTELVDAMTVMRPYYISRSDEQFWRAWQLRKETIEAGRAYAHSVNRAALVTSSEGFEPVRQLANRWLEQVMKKPTQASIDSINEVHEKMRNELHMLLMADELNLSPEGRWWRRRAKH